MVVEGTGQVTPARYELGHRMKTKRGGCQTWDAPVSIVRSLYFAVKGMEGGESDEFAQ